MRAQVVTIPIRPVNTRLLILGSTGSIGTQTLEVVTHLNGLHEKGLFPKRFEVVGLAAGKGASLLADQAGRFNVKHLALCDGNGDTPMGVFTGPDAAERLVREVECDVVLAAIVGSAGLPATLAAVELGRDVALANKEALVAAGSLVVPASHKSGAKLLPVDSEHAAVWQCLQSGPDCANGPVIPALRQAPMSVKKVTLTASGGPFRAVEKSRVQRATKAEALKHPTWTMGEKVTIDSASLMNKALEIIEAHWLFALPAEKIDAVVHPQSIAHALVEFEDASVVAQLAHPDMRGPIQQALAFPSRVPSLVKPLDLAEIATALQFEPPDREKFPLLDLAYTVIRHEGTSGAIFNASNEEAVLAFLRGEILFGRIGELVVDAMEAIASTPMRVLGDALNADKQARNHVRDSLRRAVVRA
ncbi:MAG: 1-deoxy-D-xylulose-5-phosphate reductoisomerase [Phycisphaeraceae bacterium]|nr:1-deoxy-D-xylulose-5-phosphate reductoisomerase [Phycisphaeraceae bacterium]